MVEKEIPSGVPCTSCTAQVLTFEEIKKIADNGYAIIRNPEYERGMMIRGELLFHSTDRKEAYEKLKHTAEHVAFRHFTKRDPNVVYLL